MGNIPITIFAKQKKIMSILIIFQNHFLNRGSIYVSPRRKQLRSHLLHFH